MAIIISRGLLLLAEYRDINYEFGFIDHSNHSFDSPDGYCNTRCITDALPINRHQGKKGQAEQSPPSSHLSLFSLQSVTFLPSIISCSPIIRYYRHRRLNGPYVCRISGFKKTSLNYQDCTADTNKQHVTCMKRLLIKCTSCIRIVNNVRIIA